MSKRPAETDLPGKTCQHLLQGGPRKGLRCGKPARVGVNCTEHQNRKFSPLFNATEHQITENKDVLTLHAVKFLYPMDIDKLSRVNKALESTIWAESDLIYRKCLHVAPHGVVTTERGLISQTAYYRDGQFHRTDGPAVVLENKTEDRRREMMYLNGVLTGGPMADRNFFMSQFFQSNSVCNGVLHGTCEKWDSFYYRFIASEYRFGIRITASDIPIYNQVEAKVEEGLGLDAFLGDLPRHKKFKIRDIKGLGPLK